MRPAAWPDMRWLGTIATLLLAACASADGGEDVATVSAPVERSSLTKHYAVVTSTTSAVTLRAQRATGALFVPRRSPTDGALVFASDETPIRSTCGVTFIDRTHAVTAAHCADDVDVPSPGDTVLTVELYDVAANVNFTTSARLTGTFPAYQHTKVTGTVATTRLTCKIARRCKFGQYACPDAIKASTPDITLLECADGLPADREPVEVATSDTETRGSVAVFWFHEIYDIPTALPAESDTAGRDLFAHYAAYDATGMQNFHYFGGGRNQLLPLVSVPFASPRGAIERRRLGRSEGVVWTDLFGCHGTSGSGVMQLNATTGRYELLGPVATASNDWGALRLCTDLATHAPGRKNVSYTPSDFTRGMVAGL